MHSTRNSALACRLTLLIALSYGVTVPCAVFAAPPAHAGTPSAHPAVLVGVLDTIKLFHVRSDYPFLVPKVLMGVVTAKHLTLVVTKRGLLLSPGVVTVDITDDVVAALRADPAIAALPPPSDTTSAPTDPGTTAPGPAAAPVSAGPAPVSLLITRKGFHAAPLTGDDTKSYISISCVFTNLTAKPITSLDGTIEFYDMNGTLVQSANISVPLAIGANKHVNWEGLINYNDYLDEDKKLRNTDLLALKVKFVSITAHYADGSSDSN